MLRGKTSVQFFIITVSLVITGVRNADFKRPTPDFDAEDVKVGDQLSFSVENRRIVANYKGFYNVI